MENMNSFFDTVFAFSCYSGSGFVFYVCLFETYVLYIASKETDFFTIVVFQDLGYVTADGEKVGSIWLEMYIRDVIDKPVKA